MILSIFTALFFYYTLSMIITIFLPVESELIWYFLPLNLTIQLPVVGLLLFLACMGTAISVLIIKQQYLVQKDN
ncbi:expressed protein [Phakopsora pachyrhizi]|uniref:Dolichol phosphate-mannose biosynthesis regulatory protein n=1 Tax=Phakopsora pachyrhizi TaxID=170000 RepID=A0AAV0AWW1_PHAPC|nr:expressed protein [Phakopsora pachyrhizi]